MSVSAVTSQITTGFSRLKDVFRGGINLSQYQKIIDTAKNPTIGNLSDDLINLIIKNNPFNKGEKIKAVQSIFDEVACALSNVEKLELDALKRFKPSIDNAVKILESSKTGVNKNVALDAVFDKKLLKLLSDTGESMTKKLQSILPDLNQVNISIIGEGSFGQTFKCEFLKENAEKLVSDKVFKTFRTDPNYSEKYLNCLNDVLNKFSVKNLYKTCKSRGIDVSKDFISEQKDTIGMISKALKESNGTETCAQKFHGVAAEANITEYLRHHSGHKIGPKQGLVLPDMFRFGKNPYQISEFVGDGMQASERFSFKRLGLFHTDLDLNPGNSINGVCVDIGGVVPYPVMSAPVEGSGLNLFGNCTSSIVGDKFSTRLLKRFMSCKDSDKMAFLDDLEKNAVNVKNRIDRKKILDFVTETREKFSVPEITAEPIPVSAEELNTSIRLALEC